MESRIISFDSSPNRIWIIASFILGRRWLREHLPYSYTTWTEREAAAYESADFFLEERAKSGKSSLILPLPCACVGSDSESYTERGRAKGEGGKKKKWTSHPFSFSVSGHPHLQWSRHHDAYMRKTEPTRVFFVGFFFASPNAQCRRRASGCKPTLGWRGERHMLFWWQTLGGSSSLQGPYMNLDPAVCKEEILSSIFSSAILSPKKPF